MAAGLRPALRLGLAGANGPRDLRSVAIACLGFSGLWALGASLWALHGPVLALLHGSTLKDLASQCGSVGDAWRAVSGSGGYMVLGTTSMLALMVFGSAALQDDCFPPALGRWPAWRCWPWPCS